MKFFKYILLSCLIFSLFILASACDATPPIVAPNATTGGGDMEGPDLTATPSTLPLPSSPDMSGEPNGDPTPLPKPNSTITSKTNAFPPGTSVSINVETEDASETTPPQVGPLTLTSLADIQPSITVTADSTGRISFGLYLDATTSPGRYTLSAEAADIAYTVEVTIEGGP